MATWALCVNALNLPAQQQDFGDSWITHPEFEIGEGAAGTGPAAFGKISVVRVLEEGHRILVAEAASSRVTIWTPDGSLIREVGRPGEGPGEFVGMFNVQVHREGFFTIDDRGQRFTSFANDGTFIETIPFRLARSHPAAWECGRWRYSTTARSLLLPSCRRWT